MWQQKLARWATADIEEESHDMTEDTGSAGPSPVASAGSTEQPAAAFAVQDLQRPCAQTCARLVETTRLQGFISVQLDKGDEAAVQVRLPAPRPLMVPGPLMTRHGAAVVLVG